MSYNLLFVCTGNTCRSPLAEALTRQILTERGWTGVDVASAGVAAMPGDPASPEVPEVLAEIGIEPQPHAARPLTPDLVEWADAIFVMGPSHLAVVASMGGQHKVAMVTRYLAGQAGRPVLDPIGQGIDVYRHTRDQLQRAVSGLLDQIQPVVAP